MAVVKNLMIRTGADFSGMRREMSRATKNLSDFKKNVSNTVKGIAATLATIGIGAAIKSATRDAMGFEAALQQIDRMMGESSADFRRWARSNAAAFGMGRSEAVKYGAVFSNLISTFAAGTAETAQHTQDLLKASAVISSATGRTIEDTMNRIRSGMLGSTEAIEDLGVNVNISMLESTDAFRRFAGDKSWAQLDFQTQQQIRLFGILEQTATKYGTELLSNTNTAQSKFTSQLKNAKLALGQAFLPIYNVILPALTRMATTLANAAQAVAQFSQALFGQKEQTQATVAQADAVSNLGDAYDEAGKKAKSSVSGFDQLNLIGQSSSDQEGLLPIDTSQQTSAINKVTEQMAEVSTKAQEMAKKVKAAFGEMDAFIKTHKDSILASLTALGAGFATFWVIAKGGAALQTMKTAFTVLASAVAAVGTIVAIVAVAVAALTGAFVYFYRTNEKFRNTVHDILRRIGDTAKDVWQNVLVPLGNYLATGFVKAWEATTQAAKWLWQNVLIPIGQFLIWFWHNAITPVAKAVGGVLYEAFKVVASIAKSFWQKVLVPLGKALGEMFSPAVEAVSAVLTFLWKKVMQPFMRFITHDMRPAWKGLADVIVFLLNKVLKPVVSFLGGVFKSTFNTVFDGIGVMINGLKTAFIGLMNFITGVFTGDWRRAWEGVKQIFKGVFDTLYGFVKTPLNLIISAINSLIRGLNRFSIDIPDWIAKLAGIEGGKFGFNINPIPKLAKGGLAFGPTLATVGDNRNARIDPEVIAPLSKLENMIGTDNSDVVRMLERVERAVRDIKQIQAVISRDAVGRASTEYIREEKQRGRDPLPAP